MKTYSENKYRDLMTDVKVVVSPMTGGFKRRNATAFIRKLDGKPYQSQAFSDAVKVYSVSQLRSGLGIIPGDDVRRKAIDAELRLRGALV